MRLISRPLPGMLVLQTEPRVDQRGYFARCFCRTELAQWGVTAPVEQANLSFSERALTLRGLHYQVGPSAETKVVTCLRARSTTWSSTCGRIRRPSAGTLSWNSPAAASDCW